MHILNKVFDSDITLVASFFHSCAQHKKWFIPSSPIYQFSITNVFNNCLLSASTATPDHPFTDRRRRKVASPGVHYMSPGLLQFSVLRYLGQSFSTFVQNAAARVIPGTSRCDHIIPVLRQLTSSTARLVHISHARLQVSSWPHGAISDRRLSTGRRRLRSADVDPCVIPRTNTRLGDRSFAVAGTLYQRNSVSRTLNLSHFGGC